MTAVSGEVIGREAERAAVEAFLDRAAPGLSALVMEGDAGIGKSTLWLAGVAAARERSFHVLASRPAEAEHALAYVALGDLLADAPAEALTALPGPRRRAIEAALLREEPDGPIDPRAIGVAILSLLPVLADGRPIVVAIDDDQWLDPSSAATLRFALRRSIRQPILLLLARRIDGSSPPGLEDTVDTIRIKRLRLGPLSAGAVQLLLQRRLGITFPRPTLLRLHEVSGGNPFYALELARAIAADPARDPTVPWTVPPSLERLVGGRLDALDPDTRSALLLIAAHGRLPVELLRALEIPAELLERARAASVIETSGGVIRFTHPLLASVLYQETANEERRSAHRRLAAALDDPVHRGRHLALATVAPDGALASALDVAAGAAGRHGMPIAAAELAGHALRLTAPGDVDLRHRRTIAAAHAHLAAGEGSRARLIATDLLARTPAGPRRAEALILRSELEDPGSAVTLLGEALVEAVGVPALEAAIHADLAVAGRLIEGRAWAEQHAHESLRLAELLDDNALRATALSILAPLRFDRGDPKALELAERAYRLAESLDDPRQVKRAGWSVGHVLTWSGVPDRAREWLERQLRDWRDRDEQVVSELLWYLALVELWAGRWSIAGDYSDQALGISAHYGPEVPQDHLPPALVQLHQGRIAAAREHSRRALSLARGQLLPAHNAVLAICALWSGDPAAALPEFLQAEQTSDVRGWDAPSLRWWRAEYAEALLQVGRIDAASRMVAGWETAAARLGLAWVLAQALRCRGLIAAACGDLPGAVQLLEEAADRHGAAGDPFGRARALLALGVARLRLRQKRAARAALEEALAGFEALGAPTWVAATRGELARIGGRERIGGLSPSERRVAELVAEGRTNREIAAALFLGERTVASHLTHVYAKLGIRSRTELARQLRRGDEGPLGGRGNIPTS